MPTLRLLFRSRPGVAVNAGALCAGVQEVFSANTLDIEVVSGGTGHLDLPGMTALAVGSCRQVIGDDHLELFKAMAPVIASHGEAAIFVVGRITDGGAASGCAAHTDDCPGLVITERAAAAGAGGGSAAGGRWVLAHEVGHLLGLQHVGSTANLMCDPPTAIAAGTPQLDDNQKGTTLGAAILSAAAFTAMPAKPRPRAVKPRTATRAPKKPTRKPGRRKATVKRRVVKSKAPRKARGSRRPVNRQRGRR